MAATAKEQSLGAKPTALAVVFVLLALFCSSISLLDAVYVVHFPSGATMEFSDHESSPHSSRSDGSLALLFARSTCKWPFQQEMPIRNSSPMFRLRSNVSSENSKYSSPSTVFSIPALIASKDEIFAALGVTNF